MSLQDHAAFGDFSNPTADRPLEAPSPEWNAAGRTLEGLVLERLLAIKIFGGLPLHLPPLAPAERLERIRALMDLWESGCQFAVDERLFADLLIRYRTGKDRPQPDQGAET